jgi:hypothetical protein
LRPVPNFVETGDLIRVDPSGAYLSRVKGD